MGMVSTAVVCSFGGFVRLYVCRSPTYGWVGLQVASLRSSFPAQIDIPRPRRTTSLSGFGSAHARSPCHEKPTRTQLLQSLAGPQPRHHPLHSKPYAKPYNATQPQSMHTLISRRSKSLFANVGFGPLASFPLRLRWKDLRPCASRVTIEGLGEAEDE